MLNLSYPEMVEVFCEGYSVKVKPYLTLEETDNIAHAMLEKESYLDRILIRDSMLLKYCVPDEDFNGMEYELIRASGLMNDVICHIRNLEEVDILIARAESVTTSVSEFLKVLADLATKAEKKLPKGKELSKLMEKFQGMKNDSGQSN